MEKQPKEMDTFKAAILGLIVIALFLGNNYFHEKNKIASEQATQEKELKDKQFEADQKEACLAIYKQESSKWNNVTGWRYNPTDDSCHIEYKDESPKTKAQCEKKYEDSEGKVMPIFFVDYLLCLDGKFENSF